MKSNLPVFMYAAGDSLVTRGYGHIGRRQIPRYAMRTNRTIQKVQMNIGNDCKSEGTQRQACPAYCQRKAPMKNIRQNRLAVSRQCGEIHHDKENRHL
jgi:hypothetical protein